MSNTRFMRPLMVPNDEPKSVNIDKISTALHVYYLNLIVNYLNAMQIAQIPYNFECTPCSDATSGPMNRVFDIKRATIFVGIETLSRLSIFRSMGGKRIPEVTFTDLNYWIKHPFEFSDPILKPEYL